MHKSAISLIFIAILLGMIIISVGLVDKPSELPQPVDRGFISPIRQPPPQPGDPDFIGPLPQPDPEPNLTSYIRTVLELLQDVN